MLSDEGVGIRVIERLAEKYQLPNSVKLLDGGTLGLDLLYHLEDVENLILIDAVDMNAEPGTLMEMIGDEVPSFLSIKMSPHQIGIPDMLFAAKLKDMYPRNVVLWGIQPATLEVSLELSPIIAAKVDSLVNKTIEQLQEWGYAVKLISES